MGKQEPCRGGGNGVCSGRYGPNECLKMILALLFKPARVHPQGSKMFRGLLAKGWGVVDVVPAIPGWLELYPARWNFAYPAGSHQCGRCGSRPGPPEPAEHRHYLYTTVQKNPCQKQGTELSAVAADGKGIRTGWRPPGHSQTWQPFFRAAWKLYHRAGGPTVGAVSAAGPSGTCFDGPRDGQSQTIEEPGTVVPILWMSPCTRRRLPAAHRPDLARTRMSGCFRRANDVP
jgi:hypothetical protein